MTSATPAPVGAPSAADWMVARLVTRARPGDVIVVGVGTPLALVAAMVARDVVDDITVLVGGAVDPKPRPGDGDWVAEIISHPDSLPARSAGVLGQAALLGHVQRGDITLQFVSPAQVDAAGRINTVSVPSHDTPGPFWLAGPLALPDITACVGRLVAYRASERFLVPAVDHVTGAGPDVDSDPWRPMAGAHGAGVIGVVTGGADLRWMGSGFALEAIARGSAVDDFASAVPFPIEIGQLSATAIDEHVLDAMYRLDPSRMRDREGGRR